MTCDKVASSGGSMANASVSDTGKYEHIMSMLPSLLLPRFTVDSPQMV